MADQQSVWLQRGQPVSAWPQVLFRQTAINRWKGAGDYDHREVEALMHTFTGFMYVNELNDTVVFASVDDAAACQSALNGRLHTVNCIVFLELVTEWDTESLETLTDRTPETV